MARPTQFGKDTGLQARILLTFFLLGAVYIVLLGVLFAAGAGVGVIAIVAIGLFVLQVFTSDKIALASLGAKEVSPQQAPELHAMIERLCVQADLPKPRLVVIDTPMPNAFAMGRSQKAATVAATTGIMNLLTPAELEGVMAHELSHVANRDVMVMTLASFGAAVASMILQFGFLFGGGGMHSSDDDDNPSFLVVLLVSAIVYAVSFLLMQALSRYREFAADRGAAVLTGRPSALASALLKISGQMQRVPQRDLRSAQEMNAFFIIPASAKNSIAGLFATHPPVEQRIARLERLEQQLQGTAGARLAA
jgi:heat shock protein HtpX